MVSIAGALGAWLAGLAADATDSYVLPLAVAVVLQGVAVAALRWQQTAVQSSAGIDAALPGASPAGGG